MTAPSQHQRVASDKLNTPSKSSEKLYHTVTACCRCRQRKTRCDPGIPRCEPCDRSNARCEYYDTTRNRLIPRTYITTLQQTLTQLQQEVDELERQQIHIPDAERMVRGGASIKFGEHDESRFLGPSSGIAMTRLVMELAKQNTSSKSIREVVPSLTAQDIRKKFDEESAKPTSKVYPLISSVPAPNLPSHDLMEKLVDLYMFKAQYQLPLLHEPTFRKEAEEVYQGFQDPCQNFQLRMVIANSMQLLDTHYAGLADSYYLAALPFLEGALKRMDLGALQCLILIAQYSTLTPTRTASYWIVGLAARLAQDLGLCDESTIESSSSGSQYNKLQIDMRRRLFWITLSMEYGLSHSLGRPSSLGIGVDHINVNFYEMCDDQFITPRGILPGARPIMKKCISMHFFRMRLLQAEVRRMLYLKKRDYPLSDQDQWFHDMRTKLDHWMASCPKNDEGSGFTELWFRVRLNTMIIFLHRPSPQIPEPSSDAAKRCYDAAVANISHQYQQIIRKAVPITWIFTLTLCMELNTLLWTLAYPSIRQQHPHAEVQRHIDAAIEGLEMTSDRWPGVLSAVQLYRSLIQGCLQAYRSGASYVVSSPSNKASPASVNEFSSPSTQSPDSHPSITDSGIMSASSDVQSSYSVGVAQSMPPTSASALAPAPVTSRFTQPSQFSHAHPSHNTVPRQLQGNYSSPSSGALLLNHSQSSLPPFTPAIHQWDMSNPFTSSGQPWPGMTDVQDQEPWAESIGDEYSRYLHSSIFATPQRHLSLSQQEQSELMATLESDQLPDMQPLTNESRVYYNSALT